MRSESASAGMFALAWLRTHGSLARRKEAWARGIDTCVVLISRESPREQFAKVSKCEHRVYVPLAEVLVTPTGVSKGCGIVEFTSQEDSLHAVRKLSEMTLLGRPVFIREDRETEARFSATPVPGKIGMAMAGQGGTPRHRHAPREPGDPDARPSSSGSASSSAPAVTAGAGQLPAKTMALLSQLEDRMVAAERARDEAQARTALLADNWTQLVSYLAVVDARATDARIGFARIVQQEGGGRLVLVDVPLPASASPSAHTSPRLHASAHYTGGAPYGAGAHYGDYGHYYDVPAPPPRRGGFGGLALPPLPSHTTSSSSSAHPNPNASTPGFSMAGYANSAGYGNGHRWPRAESGDYHHAPYPYARYGPTPSVGLSSSAAAANPGGAMSRRGHMLPSSHRERPDNHGRESTSTSHHESSHRERDLGGREGREGGRGRGERQVAV
ncbi:hypothetical protein DFH09DRAFT_1360405 [Mycena vulgaris]|nr:hypothetical protein DFH09DRAFT_1360405 [Mycena vulgaris]